MASSTDVISFDSGDWEVVNYGGFVCKRLRRLDQSPSSQPSIPAAADAESDGLRRRRDVILRKKKALLSLKEKYSRELHHWDSLFASFSTPHSAIADDVGPSASSPLRIPAPSNHPVVDELQLQAEAAEADNARLLDMCEDAESLCDAAEKKFAEKLIALPVWANDPKELMRCLQRPPRP